MSVAETELLFHDDTITVWLHVEPGIVHHQIHKPTRGDVFRQALLSGTAAIRDRGAKKWLSDDRRHFIVPPDDERWGRERWFPETISAGWKYWAIVKPERAVANLFLRRLGEAAQLAGVTTRFFAELEPARAWLEAIDVSSELGRPESSRADVEPSLRSQRTGEEQH